MQNTTEHSQNTQHPYAKILRAIADGKKIQYLESGQNKWFGIPHESVLLELSRHHCRHQFRIKPEVILINGIEVPKPCREPLKLGAVYYYPYLEGAVDNNYSCISWDDDAYDNRLLKLGLVHLTKEAAIKHAEALLSFTQTKE